MGMSEDHIETDRRPDIAMRKTENVSVARALGMSREIVQKYFNTLEKRLTENSLFGNIFNCDETSLQLNTRAAQMLAQKGSTYSLELHPYKVQIAQNKTPEKYSLVPDISPKKALDLVSQMSIITPAARKALRQTAAVLSSDQSITKQPKTKRQSNKRRQPFENQRKTSSSSEFKEVALANSEEDEKRLSDYENECVGRCKDFQKTTGFGVFCANVGCMKDVRTTTRYITPVELRSQRKRKPRKSARFGFTNSIITPAARKARRQIAAVLSLDQSITKQPKTKRQSNKRRQPFENQRKTSSSSEFKEVALANSEEDEKRFSDYENEYVGCGKDFQKTTGFSIFCENVGCMKDVRTTTRCVTPVELRSQRKRKVTIWWSVSYTEGGLTLLQCGG
ncbi:hypothetical protein ILUMI_00144 [Ignelater luminosus]|uniref:Uncharacterized protein n=1 Tax=Ignelater luminosus TaxID=2038154 RepID=A0A8K0GIP5_IGNLU|nr:hypothetical protein ILUMI_00144 [Ignelater luminosus]